MGRLKLKGTRDLHFYQISQIKRVRLVKRADGVYVQFCIDVDRKENTEPSGNTIGLDVEHYIQSYLRGEKNGGRPGFWLSYGPEMPSVMKRLAV